MRAGNRGLFAKYAARHRGAHYGWPRQNDSGCVRSRVQSEPLAFLLEQAQYEVHLAADGYEALDLMLNGVSDVVVTDWGMPRLKGSEFLTLSRILWPKTPVIVVSDHAVPSPVGLPQGAFGWLKKNRMGRRNRCRPSKRLSKQQLIGTGNN